MRATARVGKGARAAICGFVAFAAAALSSNTANAQGTISSTTSLTELLVFNPASITTTQVNLFSTQVLGRLNGGTVFDQTFGVPVSNPSVQSAFVAARLAVTTQGGPGVVVGMPQLISSSSTTTTSSSSVFSLAGQTTVVDPGVVTFGPAVVQVGVLSECNVSSLPSATRPSCSNLGGVTLTLGSFDTNINVNTTTTSTINTATTNATTTTLAEVYAVDGTTQAIGTAATAVVSGAYDLVSRFLRRLGDEEPESGGAAGAPLGFAPDAQRRDLPPEFRAYAASSRRWNGAAPVEAAPRYKGWAEGYGLWSRTSAQGSVPGDERRAAGMAGGFSYRVSPELALGFGVDQGFQDITLAKASETSRLDLTQLGLTAAYRSGAFVADGAVITGFADINTGRTLLGLSSAASYNATTWGVLGEAGYRLYFGNLRVTPKAGFDFISVRTGGFAETGLLALVAQANTSDRTRVWGGVELAQRFAPTATSIVDVSTYGRLVGIVSGDTVTLPVAFALAPGVPLTVQGAREGDIGFDTGARVASPLAANALVYASYDGRFRDGYQAHALSGGLRMKW